MKFIACLLALIWSSSLSAVRMVTAIDTHTFADLGTTWQRAEADSALVELGACQGSYRQVK